MSVHVNDMDQVSDDGYWKMVEGEWVPTDLQIQALQEGATPHVSNTVLAQVPGQVVIYSSSSSDGLGKVLKIVVGAIIGVALLVVLSGILYVWASSLSEETDSSLVGTWTNPETELEMMRNGDAEISSATFESWYLQSGDLYFEDEDYYYKYKYQIVNDILFLAPYDESNDGELLEEDCRALIKGENGSSESYFNDRIESAEADGDFPSWCNPN